MARLIQKSGYIKNGKATGYHGLKEAFLVSAFCTQQEIVQ